MPKNYFSWASIFLLVLSLVAFSDNLFYDIGQESNSDPKFIIHGLFFLAWFVILVIQSNFIRKGDLLAHRKWGMWGMGIALGVILSTFYVFYEVYEGWSEMEGFVKANRILTLTFAIYILLAYVNRKTPAAHKRYLFVGTLYILGPVIDRVADKLGGSSDLSFFLFETIIWHGLFISLLIYDWNALKKLHPISWMGFIWFFLIWLFTWIY
ncbi:hypothetical protein [Algoriphagus terrigena]|uniref:hypothetical protein n=1 Tax=Algoriphagus terrigena TaxID=344884 RepID=UPI00041EEF9F|nr:hypothetical protein [Algoriphagus terrigena]